ncbi:MAG: alpha/beta hydrolase [Actinobacteria bacterium]|nr:alpha/beta hydrolase [Actinomycetota bacterium]
MTGEPLIPPLPPGQHVNLPGRGTTYVRHIEGPHDAPAVVLLHGWTATADLNFFTCYEALSEHFRVVAIDHRGHGRGIRSTQPFKLSDCADDVAALADQLDIKTFIPVGYSMGGLVAQLLWKRHESRVRGLVLAATTGHFVESREERIGFLGLKGLGALARFTPRAAQDWISEQTFIQKKTAMWEPWAVQQAASHDWRHVLEAGGELGLYDARRWLPRIDVPTSVIITTRDQTVPTARQEHLASLISTARTFRVDGGHDAVIAQAPHFVPTLVEACLHVNNTAHASQSSHVVR